MQKKLAFCVIGSTFVLVFLFIAICFSVLFHTDNAVYISEVCGSNKNTPNEDGYCIDYIEFYNSSEKDIDISGFHVTDGNSASEYTFPEGTVIASESYLVVWCGMERPDYSNQLYAPFGISAEGNERISFSTRTHRVIDSCVTEKFVRHQVMIREEDLTWSLMENPTPGRNNSLVYGEAGFSNAKEDLSTVCLSEIVSSNTLYCNPDGQYLDYVELLNYGTESVDLNGFSLSDDPSTQGYVFENDTILEPGEYLVVWLGGKGENGFYGSFSLSKQGEEILLLRDPQGNVVDFIRTLPMEDNESMCLNGNQWMIYAYLTPGFDNTADGYDAWLESVGYTDAVRISELMPKNQTVLRNSKGAFEDWVELTNWGQESVNFAGWYLTDDKDDPVKYALPDVSLDGGECILLFGGNAEESNEIHMGFQLSSHGETLYLYGPGGFCADEITFQEAKQDRSYQVDPASGSIIETLYCSPGYPNTSDGYESYCALLNSSGPLAIWEVMTTNDWYMPDSDGNCYDFVEVKNISSEDINLSEFSLSDNASESSKYVFPERVLHSGEVCIILMSGDVSLTGRYEHAPFSLSGEEESLYLYQGDSLIDYVLLFDIPNKCSYGRNDDRFGFFFMTPTPGAENEQGDRRVMEEPSYDLAAGVYQTEEPLYLSLTGNGGEIYYTLDGSVPTDEDLLYNGPIIIEQTCVVRAVQCKEGCMNSDVLTLNYILNENDSLPVMCVVTDPSNLWGAKGIYRYSWDIKEVEVAGNLSYYGDDGDFSIDCGMSMHGMTSLLINPKKSFTVRFRNNYDGPLNFPFFPDRDYDEYYSLLLRADMEGSFPTMIRDTLWGKICNDYSDHCMGTDHKYCAVYLNGKFWGIYTVREHFSPEYYASRRGVPADTCKMIKSYYYPGDGMWDFYEWLEKHPLDIEENWETACTMADMESFADWMIFQTYTGNTDVNGNMRYFYCEEDGLWRCAISDVDLGMFGHETFKVPLYSVRHGKVCRHLMESPHFQQLLVEKLSYFLHGPLSEDNMISMIDELQGELVEEFPKECERWGCPLSHWNRIVNDLRKFCQGRELDLIWGIQEYVHLSKDEIEFYFGDILEKYK